MWNKSGKKNVSNLRVKRDHDEVPYVKMNRKSASKIEIASRFFSMAVRHILFGCGLIFFTGAASVADNGSSLLIDLREGSNWAVVDTDDKLRQIDSFSFDVVVKFSDFQPGNFFWLNRGWDQDGFYFHFNGDNLVLGIGDNNSLSQLVSPPDLFETGVWYRLSGVKSGESASLFVDGQKVVAGFVAADIVDSTADLTIGSGGYSPSVVVRAFTLWQEPLTDEQIIAYADGDGQVALPVPIIRYTPASVSNSTIENSVSDHYNAVFAGQDIEGESAGALAITAPQPVVELKSANLQDGLLDDHRLLFLSNEAGSPNIVRSSMLIVLTLTPVALYGCGLSMMGHRRWAFRSFPVILRLFCPIALLGALAIIALRRQQGSVLPGLTADLFAGPSIDRMENGLLVFCHLLLLTSSALGFKLVTRSSERPFDLFVKPETWSVRAFGMLLLVLGGAATIQIGAGLIELSSVSSAPSSLWAALVIAITGLVLSVVLALGDGRIFSAAKHENDTGRRLLQDSDIQRIKGKLERALDHDRLYRDPDLTLRQLSDAAGLSEHRVSEALNRHLDTNFYDLVNGRRIAEAKRILKQNQERTVLDVAMHVGFNSKSTFYTAFKKVSGQSPVAYRRSAGEPDGCPEKPAGADPMRSDAATAQDTPSRPVAP